MSITLSLRTAGLALTAATIAAPAFAGGFAEPVATPVVPPAAVAPALVAQSGDWSGAYIGGEAAFGDFSFDDYSPFALDASLAGLFAGYRRDFGRFVLGGELSYSAGEIGFDIAELEGLTDFDAELLRAGLQLGYDFDRALPYFTLGYASLSLDDSDSQVIFGEGAEIDGTYFGVGADFAVTPRFTLGAQYLVHNFEGDLASATSELDAFDTRLETFGIRAAYNF